MSLQGTRNAQLEVKEHSRRQCVQYVTIEQVCIGLGWCGRRRMHRSTCGHQCDLAEIASYLLNRRQAARNVGARDRCGIGTQILFSVAEISQPNRSQPVKKGALNSERGVQMKKLLLGTLALVAGMAAPAAAADMRVRPVA